MKNFPDDDNEKQNSEHYEAMSVFCNRYAPATKDTLTDLFSTNEIKKLIKDHVGIDMRTTEICELLISMNYTYKLDEQNFMWMVKET